MEEDYDQDIPLIEWAVISGVPEQELNHSRLREFFSWLIPQLNAHSIASNKNGVFFAPAPRTTIIVRRKGKGGDVSASGDRRRKNEIEEKTEAAESESVSVKDRTRDAYLSVRDNYPSVVTVFNVLPGPNCEEYEWMRKFAIEFGVVRQGIQKENVLTQFQATGAPVDQIFANVLSWVEKSIGEMGGCTNIGHGGKLHTLTVTVDQQGDEGSVMEAEFNVEDKWQEELDGKVAAPRDCPYIS